MGHFNLLCQLSCPTTAHPVAPIAANCSAVRISKLQIQFFDKQQSRFASRLWTILFPVSKDDGEQCDLICQYFSTLAKYFLAIFKP